MIKSENPNSGDDQFDGQLICVVGGDISSSGNISPVIWENALKSRGHVTNGPNFYPPVLFVDKVDRKPILLNSTADLLPIALYGEGEESLDMRPLIDSQKDILEIIRNGRIRISILLNSLGGNVGIANRIGELFDYIRARGGVVDAYVSSVSASAAAIMFGQADNRFVLADSLAMWHAKRPDLSSPLMPFFEAIHGSIDMGNECKKNIDQHKKTFGNFLNRNVVDSKKGEAVAALELACSDPLQNPLGEIWFSGRQLQGFGIAHDIFMDLASMEEFFVRRAGINPDAMFEANSRLDNFFSVSAFEEHLREVSSVYVKTEKRDRNWTMPMIGTKEDARFSFEDKTKSAYDRVIACKDQISDFYDPLLAGRNVRLKNAQKWLKQAVFRF